LVSSFRPEDCPAERWPSANNRIFDGKTGLAYQWRRHARIESDGITYFDGLMLDGWERLSRPL
jgi:hypothetical protein